MGKEITYKSRDELGKMATLINETNKLQSSILSDVIEKLLQISRGDLKIQLELEYPEISRRFVTRSRIRFQA